jgi:hypothetical protein
LVKIISEKCNILKNTIKMKWHKFQRKNRIKKRKKKNKGDLKAHQDRVTTFDLI